ncbi:MAG: TIGR03503 family protein, partial [Shewanella sp.]|nr:TIGR03503 family protein [Shewanella sp.]
MPMSCHKPILALCLVVTTLFASVTSVLAAEAETAKKVVKPPKAAPIIGLETASELKNRFRIDHMVDNMTLLVEREYGSAPVVIVLPDGSKWYANRHPETVKWVDGITGDIIYIESPMPGPW